MGHAIPTPESDTVYGEPGADRNGNSVFRTQNVWPPIVHRSARLLAATRPSSAIPELLHCVVWYAENTPAV